MKLEEALLCVDCETLYSLASRCPQCGSQVCFPLSRALNRSRAPVERIARPQQLAPEEFETEQPPTGVAALSLRLVQSA